jgi:glucan phosphorylase
VLQLSTLDGWVIEAVNDDIGWIFGTQHKGENIGSEHHLQLQEDAQSLYETLEKVAGLYYATNNKGNVTVQSAWIDKMINCIRTSAFFTTDRMVKEYFKLMWSL